MQGPVGCLTVQQLYHQNMSSISTFVWARNDGVSLMTLNPPVEAQASISRATTLSSVLYPPCCVPLQRAEMSSLLLLSLVTGAGGLERHDHFSTVVSQS